MQQLQQQRSNNGNQQHIFTAQDYQLNQDQIDKNDQTVEEPGSPLPPHITNTSTRVAARPGISINSNEPSKHNVSPSLPPDNLPTSTITIKHPDTQGQYETQPQGSTQETTPNTQQNHHTIELIVTSASGGPSHDNSAYSNLTSTATSAAH